MQHPTPCQPAAYCLVYLSIKIDLDVKKKHILAVCLNVTLASTLEEESDNKHLQRTHTDNKSNLDHAEVDNALLRARDSAEVTVLTCSKVFLVSGNGGKLAGDLEDGLLQDGSLLW